MRKEIKILAKDLISKAVINNGVVFFEYINTYDYGLTYKEASLFVIICDNFKNNRINTVNNFLRDCDCTLKEWEEVLISLRELENLGYIKAFQKDNEIIMFPVFALDTEVEKQLKGGAK